MSSKPHLPCPAHCGGTQTRPSAGSSLFAGRSALLVAGLEQCQYALRQGGYLAAFPSAFFDRLEALQPVWVPYYTVRAA